MNLSAPKVLSWWIAVILGAIGVIVYIVPVAGLSPYAFWLVVVSAALLALASLLKDL